MTRLSPPDYLAHIRQDSLRFRDVLAETDPAAHVPSCPDWRAADLLWHLGEVQHWWTAMIENRPSSPDDMGYADPQRPQEYADLLAFADSGSASLAAALEKADPDEEAWTWSQDHTVAFILRRQAHEALIHRRDAELAARAVSPFDPALATDGVAEALDVMFGGLPPWGRWTPIDHYVRVDCTDTGTSIWVQLGVFSGTEPDGTEHPGEDDIHVVKDPGVEPDAVVSGRAEDVDTWLWRRSDDSGVRVTGDRAIYERFRVCVNHPIN
jgi:uncharacterized protein (TIGR03083 family)